MWIDDASAAEFCARRRPGRSVSMGQEAVMTQPASIIA
jgi:hypothetical protein